MENKSDLRVELQTELESARQSFYRLLDALEAVDWHIPSGNPSWTIGEVLFHIAMPLLFIPAEVQAIRKQRWTPPIPLSLFDLFNKLFTRIAGQRYTRSSLRRFYDKHHQRTLDTLTQVGNGEWQLSATYPDAHPPLISGQVSIENLFRLPAHHLKIHEQEIRQGLTVLNERPSDTAPEPDFVQKQIGIMTYPGKGWRKAIFRMPLALWRLGLGPVVGKIFLLLTHTGRKSGLFLRTPVEYHTLAGKKYAPCAFGKQSDWYKNIQANPLVTIQTSRGVESARAVRVGDDRELLAVYELFRRRDPPLLNLYLKSLDIRPEPADILAKKDRIYWIRFDSVDEPTPPPVKPDLIWVWPLVLGVAIFTSWLSKRNS